METSTRINKRLNAAMKAAIELKKRINEISRLEEEVEYFNCELMEFDRLEDHAVRAIEGIGVFIGRSAVINAINKTNKV